MLAHPYWLPARMFCLHLRRFFLTLLAGSPTFTSAAPPGFPASGNGLWYTNPAGISWTKTYLPIGNGYLAAMTPGGTWQEATQLNIESLWSGGPFADPNYNGGNKQPGEQASVAAETQKIRAAIFESPNGEIENIDVLNSDAGAYGSYSGAGYFVSTINASQPFTDYARFLDMEKGLTRALWTSENVSFVRESFCSNPSKACVQRTSSVSKGTVKPVPLPTLTYAWSSALQQDLPAANVTCLDSSTLSIRGFVANPGMLYEILGRVHTSSNNGAKISCTPLNVSPPNATITVTGASDAYITWVGDTEYSMDAGDAAHNFSFKGPDPHAALLKLVNAPSLQRAYPQILREHVSDWTSVLSSFSLSIGQKPDFDKPTDVLKDAYIADVGNPYLEWLTFNLGRYLLVGSARGKIPANLQGKWAKGSGNPWSADYHANINTQMNYWAADITGLDVSKPLFDYMAKTWVPRGEYTAKVLYNITRGWVVHNEMNLFGHTGMKGFPPWNSAQWANYPEANAWMMFHVWDYFDYTNDVAWWKAQGYPLLKGAAAFHLDKLIPDLRFNDSSLVVSPCNSPEQVPITLGCAHAQQVIWQLFNAVEKGFAAAGDRDVAFLKEIQDKRARMDKGLHVGSWGQLQEYKVDKDSPSDTHRHLSHLIGLYPGYAIASYDPAVQQGPGPVAYTKEEILTATATSLLARGNGTGPDADSGWEKAWRAASWAQLGDENRFYNALTYTIARNLGPNLFSLYNPFEADPIFQIDANLAFPAALLNALIHAPDVPSASTPLTITILPALPSQWPDGNIKAFRVRGGLLVDLEWKAGKATRVTISAATRVVPRPVKVVYKSAILGSFKSSAGLKKTFVVG